MATRWFLCSTPLHIFSAFALADNLFLNEENILFLIDQIDIENNDYYNLIAELEHKPFKRVHIFQGRIKHPIKKVKSRRKITAQLKTLIDEQAPDEIFTGNDRRIEFQTAMHLAKAKNPNCFGVYMDEGTFTYMGRAASKSWNDRVVDNVVKKLVYGAWWENPNTVGASSWIKEVYAAFPELVVKELSTKIRKPIRADYYQSKAPSELANHLLSHYNVKAHTLDNIKLLITLPHESLVEAEPKIKEYFLSYVREHSSETGLTAIKYHPRDLTHNWLDLDENINLFLPKRVNFESLLPILPRDCTIIGDVSTTLLTARWMRPDLEVIALKTPYTNQNFLSTITKLGVNIVDIKV